MSMAKNRFKKDLTDNEVTKDSRPKKSRKKVATKINLPQNEQVKKISGLLLLLISIYLLIAFTSYLFTGNADQSILNIPTSELTDEQEIKNWLGIYGAVISQKLIGDWFGIASFSFVFILFLSGFWVLFKHKLVSFKETFKYSIFSWLWLSTTLGYLFDEGALLYLGGGVGHAINNWLAIAIGSAGTFFLVLFSLIGFVLVNFKIEISSFGELLNQKADDSFNTKTNNNVSPSLNDSLNQEYELEEDVPTVDELLGPTEIREESNTEDEEIAGNEIPEPVLKENSQITSEPIKHEKTETEETDSNVELILDQAEKAHTLEEAPDEKLGIEHEYEDLQSPPPPPVVPEIEVLLNIEEEAQSIDLDTNIPEEELENEESEDELTIELAKPKEEVLLTDSEIKEEVESILEKHGEYDPKLDFARYQLPHINFLVDHGDGSVQIDREVLEANKNKIVETLKNYKIEISQIKATIGPTVTLYEIVPAAGVRISKIKNLEDDIALSLAALGIRIIAPIPGKGAIGIEVPNLKPDIVSMKTLIASERFIKSDMALPVVLGKTISNEIFVADLAKMPHLLMAGATGQGKSVGLNAILVSLLYRRHPSEIKFVLVDPKKVELTLYNKIERHYLAKLPDSDEPIITDTTKVVHTLNSLCIEMDQRYELLKNAMVRNIKEYNAKFIKRKLNPEKGHRYLPYIVLVIDEFADLIMTAGKEVETPIARLAQLARAIGIHLIIATQRPSVNVITGIIKANFPARIAFRVTSKIDSRTILDTGGAEQLIGRGDMLFTQGSDVVRIQCGFVDTPEVEEITEFIGSQQGKEAFELPEYEDEQGGGSGSHAEALKDRDALFEDAAKIIVQHQQGSASLLQRRLKLGYNRAGRIVDQLEAAGIIGPFEGSKARQVLIPDELALEQLLNNLDS